MECVAIKSSNYAPAAELDEKKKKEKNRDQSAFLPSITAETTPAYIPIVSLCSLALSLS